MESKENRLSSNQELKKKKKTMVVILAVLVTLIAAYIIYFSITIYKDNWSDTHSMGSVGLLVIAVASIMILRNLSSINQSLQKEE